MSLAKNISISYWRLVYWIFTDDENVLKIYEIPVEFTEDYNLALHPIVLPVEVFHQNTCKKNSSIFSTFNERRDPTCIGTVLDDIKWIFLPIYLPSNRMYI